NRINPQNSFILDESMTKIFRKVIIPKIREKHNLGFIEAVFFFHDHKKIWQMFDFLSSDICQN
ncbi:MAG: hypothetical protein RLZZ306_1442, partial [Bacteroidota bacterium]